MASNYPDEQRAVITGIGVITPLGDSVEKMWTNLVAGKSGIRRITAFDPVNTGVKVAGELDFSPNGRIDHKDARRMSRDSQLAQVATQDAMRDAGLRKEDLEAIADRVGVVMGTTLGGWELGLHQL